MDFAFDEYSRSVYRAGGAPMIIPVAQNRQTLETVLDRIDGVILTRGVDINPRRYGEQPLAGMGEIDEDLDILELDVVQMAFDKDLPIFAICRGIQILNVALGGTLFQDIAAQVKESLLHSQKAPKNVMTHAIDIREETLLKTVIGKNRIWVNSKHHQAVKDLAQGFRIGAETRDGIIEAIEHPSKRFVLGVQWHPEGIYHVDTNSKKLFRAFIQASVS